MCTFKGACVNILSNKFAPWGDWCVDLFPKEERKKESSQTQGMKLLEQQGGNRRGKQKQIHLKIKFEVETVRSQSGSTHLALLQ